MVFAGADGTFSLDEETEDHSWCRTEFSYQWGRDAVLNIQPMDTKQAGMPETRTYEIVFAGTADGMTAQLQKADGSLEELSVVYDREKQCSVVSAVSEKIDTAVTIVTHQTALADNNVKERIFDLLNKAEIEFSLKERIYAVVQKKGSRSDAFLLDQLTLLHLDEDLFGAVKELLTALE